MLRCVRLKNFVHFIEEQVLTFEEGTCFLIGQNNSGKSTVFEAIRRCMSFSKNGSISSVHNDKEPGIAMCIYNMGEKSDFFVSSIILFPQPVFKTFKYVKIAYSSTSIGDSSDKYRVGIDLIRNIDDHELENYKLSLSETHSKTITGVFGSLKQACSAEEDVFSIAKFLETIKTIIIEACSEPHTPPTVHVGDKKNTPCESMLKSCVDTNTVITFALRSINPAQWTNSQRIGPKHKKATYEEVQKRAEILSWYIDKKSGREITAEEQHAEKEIFDKLTGRPDFDFKRNHRGELIACYGDVREASILKVPEGYYEAKKCSIMLAIKSFTTVCFEDPDRGMHPQMVTRLRDLILPNIEHKVVLIISHNPCFISANTILQTVFFQRDENALCFRTISGNQIKIELDKTDTRTWQAKRRRPSDSGETVKSKRQMREHSNIELGGEKDHRIIASAHFSTLFFAKRVMFVEGEGDFLFMEEFRSIVMNKSKDNIFRTIIGEGIDMALMRQYLCLMQFIPLGGHTKKARLNSVGKAINLERAFLLDYDALTEKEEEKEENVDKFIAEFDLHGPDFAVDTIIKDLTRLEKVNVFVWKKPEGAKNGTIEQAIIALNPAPTDNSLRTFLLENHVELKFPMVEKEDNTQSAKKKKSKDKKFKLFVHPDLTAENISNCVKEIISLAADQNASDIHRLVKFMYNLCRKSKLE